MPPLNTIISLFLLLFTFNSLCAQTYLSETLEYDDEIRSYDIYVPSSYDGSTPLPLIFSFHGGNGYISDQIAIADMSDLADAEGFFAVYPQALPDPNDDGSTNWIHKDPSGIDDVFFVDALIDAVADDYAIDLNRVYASGYSLGGEFTYEVGCRLNERIAAIGVVARTMQTYTEENCVPSHPTGLISILGTDDFISPYDGLSWAGIEYYISADDAHGYWATHNDCDPDPVITDVPNTSTSDGSTVERHTWSTTDGCSYVEHLKVLGGGHDWPGSFGNMDIDATTEIWNFVSRYDLNGLIDCNSIGILESGNTIENIQVLSNPFAQQLQFENHLPNTKNFTIYALTGELVHKGSIQPNQTSLDLSALSPNVYLLSIHRQSIKIVKTD